MGLLPWAVFVSPSWTAHLGEIQLPFCEVALWRDPTGLEKKKLVSELERSPPPQHTLPPPFLQKGLLMKLSLAQELDYNLMTGLEPEALILASF